MRLMLALTMVVVTIVGMAWYVTDRLRAHEMNTLLAIRTCNRTGGIYAAGVCQQVFAPICRRL